MEDIKLSQSVKLNDFAKAVIEKKIARTMKAIESNCMQPFYCQNKDEVVDVVKSITTPDDVVACGGSVTLAECGVIDLFKSGYYKEYLDRLQQGLSQQEMDIIVRKAFFADSFFSSSNAITEEGELYNVDGVGNRVSAMIFGPKSVIVVVGFNKIVKDLDDAFARNREIAAPANTIRLDKNTPCKTSGYCQNCKSDDRICCDYVIMAKQRVKNRVKVIIVGEELGF